MCGIFSGAARRNGVSLELKGEPTEYTLRSDSVDPQLVIWQFQVTAHGHKNMVGRLVHGQLHIRTPTGKNNTRVPYKQKITREALGILEGVCNSGAPQPAVCILTGDVNLTQYLSTIVLQPRGGNNANYYNQWHTQTSNKGNSGDLAFIKGSRSSSWDVTIGCSYDDRGMRPDSHDFFGVTVRVPLLPDPSAPITLWRQVYHGASASSFLPEPQPEPQVIEKSQVVAGTKEELAPPAFSANPPLAAADTEPATPDVAMQIQENKEKQ